MHTKLIGGTLMLPAPDRTIRFARGTVRIEDRTIAAVEETDTLPALDLGGDDYLICPGFIDTHLHLPQFDSIGIGGLELLDWLDRVIFPAETRWEDPDYAEAMTERVLNQLASFGTTSFAAYATVHHEAARRAISMIQAWGIRAMVGQVLMDRNAPTELVRPAKQLIKEASSLEPTGRVEVAVTPRFAISCSDELLEASGELARKTGAPVQTHLAETRRECALIGELFNGLPYTEVYKKSGLLGPRSILAHGIWLDDVDRTMLSDSGSIIAHCPTANLFLDAGRHDRPRALAAGVTVTLGSDVAGGPDRSMVRVARAMIETARNRGDTPPTASQAWYQITGGNAEALGWGGSRNHAKGSGAACVGTLEPGAEADLLVVEPTIDWQETTDPAGTLLYTWDDRWLEQTLITGRPAWQRE